MHETSTGTFILPRASKAIRRVTMGVKQHFTGSLIIGEGEGQVIEFESHTEMKTALVMLARQEVMDVENQIPFSWIDETGISRTHFFDFRLSMRDGTRAALIVKNSRKAAKQDFIAETRCLASQVTPDFANRVSLITENHLDPIEVHNAELIHSVRLPDPKPDAAVRKVIAQLDGAMTIKDLATATAPFGQGFFAVVRMIGKHELELVNRERIEPEVLVRRKFN
ncbi:hypothetical protein [Sulfitobacter dubius]|uniref:hypothetical protein n=1 Tax=Sulfitobacter dubius TaxID=218673 RepID=UPI0022AFC42C|nr:hypothetical protein [Sulfitobacter dubius]MCZ4368833.1 hypothetical protein [Sulfitobacter dubius]